MKRLLRGPRTGVAQEPGVATHQPSVLKASPASVPTAMLMSACVLLQTRKSARAGVETIASRARANGRSFRRKPSSGRHSRFGRTGVLPDALWPATFSPGEKEGLASLRPLSLGERAGVRAGGLDRNSSCSRGRACKDTNDRDLPIARRCVRPSLAVISVEFAPFLFPDPVRTLDNDGDLELIRKLDGAREGILGRHRLGHPIRR